MSLRKELKELLATARAQGWRVELRRSGHYLLYAPDGVHMVVIAGTPSDRRAIDITVSRMRRYGFVWKGR